MSGTIDVELARLGCLVGPGKGAGGMASHYGKNYVWDDRTSLGTRLAPQSLLDRLIQHLRIQYLPFGQSTIA